MSLDSLLKHLRINGDTLRCVEGWEDNGILQLEIAGAKAHEIWTRLAASTDAAGYYLVVTTDDYLRFLTQCEEEPREVPRGESLAAARDAVLARAKQITFSDWLSQQRDPAQRAEEYIRMAEQIEPIPNSKDLVRTYRQAAEDCRNAPAWQFDPSKCPWPDEPVVLRPPDELFEVHDGYQNVTADHAAVLFVPTVNSWEVPAHLLFGGFNACPPPEVHVAMLQSLQSRYEARPLLIAHGTLEIIVGRRPVERHEALRLAADFMTYAESFLGVDYNKQSEGRIAAYLMESDHWALWWD